MPCPDDDALASLLDSTLRVDEREALLAHLDGCETCRALVADAAALTPETGDSGDATLGRGDTIGRYVVDRIVGAGAMGTVYAAHDPELARDVAIKALHAERASREALLREARVLAQLSHPNVVAIHDVIADGDRLAVAIELVEGTTLAAWLAAAPRTWPAIRDVMLEAGRGLAAAHARGIVHRDIKPANILVGRDGRTRVGDFGLANLPAGTAGGTPAYMAPEQRTGAAVDARSDVYSFCVVLDEIMTQVRGVPARVRRSIARGRDRDPANRPSLDAVLASMTPRRSPAIALGLAGVATAVIAVAASHARPDACTGAAAAWGSPWDASAIRRAFDATGLASAATAFAHADAAIGTYRTDWMRVHHDVCMATERKEQSADLLDRRMRCLDNRRRSVAALATVLATADRATADRAGELVRGLPTPDDCTSAAVADLAAPPTDRATLTRLEEVQATASAQQLAQRTGDCVATLTPAIPQAQQLSYPPLLAHMLLTRALCEADIEHTIDDLHAAATAAAAGRDDETLALAWTRLVYVKGFVEHELPEAERWERYARAVIDRLGAPPRLQLAWLNNAGLARIAAVHMDEARALNEQRRALIVATQGRDAPLLADVEETIGSTYLDEWRYADAYAYYQRAEAIIARTQHSMFARLWLLQNESVALRGLGRAHDALALFPEIFALLVQRDPDGDDSWARNIYGDALRDAGDPARARAEHQKARATCERFSGTHAYRCAATWYSEGRDLIALGRAAEARAPIERAIVLYGPGGAEPDAPFTLALATAPTDMPRAIALATDAQTALRTFVDAHHADRTRLDEIDAWLAAHRR